MPYPLPDGDSYEESLRWFLVAVPDRPEYVTAGLGAYTEFGNRYLWGKEGPTDESDNAAQSWHLAIAATLEALEMGFPDILLGYIDDVEVLLRAIRDTQCCGPGGDSITSTSGDLVIDPIGISVDEPPLDLTDSMTWPPDYETDPAGQTAFQDFAAISDFLCRSANVVFTLLLDMLTIAGWAHELAWGINSVIQEWIRAAIVRLFPTVAGTITAFAYDQLWALGSPWLQQMDKAMLDGARAEIATAQDDIVCAWANAYTYEQALSETEAILDLVLTSTIVYAWLTSGGVIGFVLGLLFRLWADPLDYTCECQPGDYGTWSGVWYTILTATGTDAANYRVATDGSNSSADYVFTNRSYDTNAALPRDVARAPGTPLAAITAGTELLDNNARTSSALSYLKIGFHNSASGLERHLGGTVRVDKVYHVSSAAWVDVLAIEVISSTYGDVTVSGTTLTYPNHTLPPSSSNYAIVRLRLDI